MGTGFKRFGKGLFEGVTGIVVNPIKEGKKSGVKGVFKGIGTGLTGLVFKPAAGVIDLASSTMSGMEAAMGKSTHLFRTVQLASCQQLY